MSQPLFERYKDALRRGHVAAQRSHYDAALDAYGEAARLAPDRAMPLVGIGSVLTRLDRPVEALAAYDAALERAPADEGALRGRAELALRTGDRTDAAETLDRLAAALDAAGRPADALEAAARALELAESRGRRDALRAALERFLEDSGDVEPNLAAGVARAQALLRGPVAADAGPIEPDEPPFDPGAAIAAVEEAAAGSDPVATRELALAAAAGHRAAGQSHAAIDACYLALASNPADPALHLALAELYLDRGWRAAATEKLALLSRLVDLTEDEASRARLCAIVRDRLPDEPSLTARCA
jgi:tetratricopeptide (TPR) repeat protein